MLEVRNLAKSFGSLAALDDVTFGVGARTITGLIGPNGAGKTTLFDTVAGMQRADRGEIRLRGERIDGERPDRIFRRGLARTFQIPRPFGGMTVLENVMLAPGGQAGERFWNSWIRYQPGGPRGARHPPARAGAAAVLRAGRSGRRAGADALGGPAEAPGAGPRPHGGRRA